MRGFIEFWLCRLLDALSVYARIRDWWRRDLAACTRGCTGFLSFLSPVRAGRQTLVRGEGDEHDV